MLLETISAKTRVSQDKLLKIASNASRRYHEFSIPKRNGEMRTIAHPSRSLKALQRFIARIVFGPCPVHPAATAYVKGASIRQNAECHAGYRFTVRLDFEGFFDSFDSASVRKFVENSSQQNNISLSRQDIEFICKIVCRSGRLPIGAPSSPRITNCMMFAFDNECFNASSDLGVVYTRYADDIFISGNSKGDVDRIVRFVRTMTSNSRLPMLTINEEKTLHLSKASYRSVTGLVLTPQGGISLGRARKREVRSLIYKALSGDNKIQDSSYLKGMIAFCYGSEPDFIRRLDEKFGIDTMEWAKSL